MIEQNDIRSNPDVQTGIRLTLRDMLYNGHLTIEEFKAHCTESGIDYNNVEHCCGCAGCYEPVDTDLCDLCPDCSVDGCKCMCKIVDPRYCNICGEKAEIGYPITDSDDKQLLTFWTCEKHSHNKSIERQLRKDASTRKLEWLVKKWNK